jgi:undecaprenyl diphosphate synthase
MAIDFTIQSSSPRKLHAAIIMDGNGRWATMRGLPRIAGHRAGADAVRRTVEAAPDLGVGVLTLYAFSSDNWRRPTTEVSALMELLDIYLRKETRRCQQNGVRLEVIGRRDRLDKRLVTAIERAEAATASGGTLTLRVAVDYSARDAILQGKIGPDVDLLIRTGGEQRLSDFLLWECAYAELIFSRRMWPDFDIHDLASAIREFQTRERRFGALLEPQTVATATGATSWLD